MLSSTDNVDGGMKITGKSICINEENKAETERVLKTGGNDMADYIAIMDGNALLQITYEDMIKYHGRFNIGGVAIAYQAIKLGFSKLSPDEIPDREDTGFFSGMSGSGVLDGAEMVMRARTRGTLVVDPALGADAAAAGGCRGRFYFEVRLKDKKIGLVLKESFVKAEFADLAKGFNEGRLTPKERERLQELKEELAAAVMATPAEQVFDVVAT